MKFFNKLALIILVTGYQVQIHANKACLETESFKTLSQGSNDQLDKATFHAASCCNEAYNLYAKSPAEPQEEEQDWLYNDCISVLAQNLSDEDYENTMKQKNLEYLAYFNAEKRPGQEEDIEWSLVNPEGDIEEQQHAMLFQGNSLENLNND
ncbi:MAG: hypothetical protein P4L22_01420 [Candidatus Babeliales bacterium]|nr:hypothetical protein [Candidatus Babeliales bacterium]